jgi:3-hydroxybutyryl-CoA dehydrogenase
MHFFNPATKMRLVEVIVGAGTSEESVRRARELVDALGKTAVTCRDSPNFVVNRVCRPLYYEAQLLVSQGLEPAVVDAAARGALGHPMGPLQLLDFTGLHTHLASSETALREFGDPRYRPIPQVRGLVRAGMTGRAAGRGFYDYAKEKPRDAQQRAVRPPGQPDGVRVVFTGPDAQAFEQKAPQDRADAAEAGSAGTSEIVVYTCHRPPSSCDVATVHELAQRRSVVVDSSDGGWLEVLPDGVGWVRLHRPPRGGVFAEVVHDSVAGVEPTAAVTSLLDALGADSVQVLALPGLVADRLATCMVNEASVVVEEGTASRDDVDVALRLAMNHPVGPFERLADDGAPRVYAALRSMADLVGDPRYRPSQLLRRQALARGRS